MIYGGRKEIEILLSCVQHWANFEETVGIREILVNGVDWEYLLRFAGLHGLMPLLFHRLNSICPEAVPAPILSRLKNHFNANLGYNRFLTGELLKLLSLFESHGVPAVPFKGPVLASSVYGDLSLRQFSDLDILIQEKDFNKLKTLLFSQGYSAVYQLNRVQEASSIRRGCQYHFRHQKTGINLEIFWEFGPKGISFPMNLRHLCNRLEKASFFGNTILAFSPEDLLHILCFHGYKHAWEALEWICDIAGLIQLHQEMDWRRVMEEAARVDSEPTLFLGLYLAKTLLDIDLPDYVWQKVQADTKIKSLARMVYKDLFNERNGSLGFLERSLFHLKSIKTLRERFRYCYYSAIPPSFVEFEILKLPSYLFFLYYPFRLFRLLGKYSVGQLIHK